MWNWFDPLSWYPLGRIVGATLYPGLMSTSAFVYWLLELMSLPTNIRDVCVFIAPVFAAFTAITTYFFTYEVTNHPFAGLYSAFFMALVPAYIQRSVAGSYDNEAVSIFALIFTFYMYIKAVNTVKI
jgi:dolichyl-diphosphooligosaccharide--protein glycosyltransferase